MGFKEVQDLNPDTVITIGGTNKKTGAKNPSTIEGYFLGTREVEDRKKKSGKSYIYVLQTSKGNVGVWGKTDLDNKMKNVAAGTMIRVSANGTRNTPNGDMYLFKVEVDADNTIEVSAPQAASASDVSEDEAGGYSNDDSTEEDTEANELLAEQALLEAAARKAKVQALLNKTKKA